MEEIVQEIPIHQINLDTNVRESADTDLVQSIEKLGVLVPGIVRKTSNKKYDLVVGKRRLLACVELGRETFPAIVREMADGELVAASLAENVERRGMTCIEEAHAIARLMENGWTVEQLADVFDHTGRWVRDRVALLQLPKKTQSQLHKGDMPVNAGLLLLRLKGKARDAAFTRLAEGVDARQILHSFRYREDRRMFPDEVPEECRGCSSLGATYPQLFGIDEDDEDTAYCYDPSCFDRKQAAVLAADVRAKADEGYQVVSIEARRKELRDEGVEAHEVDKKVNWVLLENALTHGFEECATCEKRGVLEENGNLVCLDEKCLNRMVARRKREEKKATETSKEIAEPELFPRAKVFSAHALEKAHLQESVVDALNNDGRLANAFMYLIAYNAHVMLYSDEKQRKADGLVKDPLRALLLMDAEGLWSVAKTAASRYVRKDASTETLLTAGRLAGIDRAKDYVPSKELLQIFTKAAIVEMAKAAGFTVTADCKKEELIDKVIDGWPVGVLPEVVKRFWS